MGLQQANLATLGSTFHDESQYTIACPDGKKYIYKQSICLNDVHSDTPRINSNYLYNNKGAKFGWQLPMR